VSAPTKLPVRRSRAREGSLPTNDIQQLVETTSMDKKTNAPTTRKMTNLFEGVSTTEASQVEQGAQDLFSQGFNQRSHCSVVLYDHPLDMPMFLVERTLGGRLTPLAMKKEQYH
jgi:hypothetical protein